MNLYSVNDLSETLRRVRIDRDEIKQVLYAWGDTWRPNSIGNEEEPYDSIKGDSDWEGGFIIYLKDKRVLCITGRCDFTGWGCVDSVTIKQINHFPPDYSVEKIKESFSINEKIKLDKDPIDLNRWVKKEIELSIE